MAIFGRRRFTPKVLPERGATPQAWQRAAERLDYERNAVGERMDKFERYLAEHVRRQQGAPRHASQARGSYPLIELIPPYELVMCDVCHTRTPLALLREVIQWQDTTLRRPLRVWNACSTSCSQFLQRTLKSDPDAPGARARSTIPLMDRGRV